MSGYGTGGPGGASGTNLGTFLSGSNGSNGNGAAGGAGGGSVGRIHILNGTGKLTPGPGVILSPNLNVGPTTVGKIGLQ